MFRNGSSGVGTLVGVSVIVALYLTTVGLMWKTYNDGAESQPTAVCASSESPLAKC